MAAPPLARATPGPHPVHLLLLEDNPGDARLVQAMLSEAPEIEIHQAARLAQALEHLASHETDAVLLDLGLPDSEGLETLRAVKRAAPDDPIVVLTGRDDEELGQAALREGAQDYVSKSQVVGAALVRSIRYAVERQEHVRRIEHLARVLRAIRGMNQLASSEGEPEQLVQRACDLLVAEHGYRKAWIALDAEGSGGTALAQAGWGDALRALAEEVRAGRGPPCRSEIGAGHVFAATVVEASCRRCVLRGACRSAGTMLAPLRHGERIHGLIGVVPRAEVAPTADERELIAQVASDIAVALHGSALERGRRHSEAYARSLIEASLDPLVTISPAGRITDVNRATEQATGVPRSRIIGTDFASYFTDPEQARTAWRQVLAAGELRDYPLTIRAADGRTTEVLYNASPYCPNGVPEGVFAAARDVTERKRAEAERLRIEEELRRAQKLDAVGRLAGGIAHDFNNMLTVILGAAEVLLQEIGAEGPRGRVEEIQEAAARAAALTKQLLIFTRRTVIQPRVIDVNAVVASVKRMLRRIIRENIEIVTQLDPELVRVRADPTHVEQVITNLVVNARDAMPRGGTLTIRTANAEIAEGRGAGSDLLPGRYATISVRDTGQGMSAEVRAHIFEPFFTTKPPGQGTGLGLSTVYGIVREAGGAVRVFSEPGSGTALEVYLPMVSGTPDEVAPARTGPTPTGTESILLVEDEPVLRALEAEMLRRLGYDVVDASDGEEAFRVAGAHARAFDLVVTDIVMPRVGGRELVARLRAERPDTKVLFVSGYSEPPPGGEGPAGDAPLLQKPFTPDRLARCVRDVLDVAGLQEQPRRPPQSPPR